jgi:DNA-binding phage protein
MENKGNKLNFTTDDIKSSYKDFRDFYTNHLKNNPSEIKHYKEQLVKDFNETKDVPAFLEGLKTIAAAEGRIKELAKNAKVERTSVYRMLSKKT